MGRPETSGEPDAAVGTPRPVVPSRWATFGLVAVVVLVADQLTKWWAVRTLAPPPMGEGRVIDVVWTLRFNYAENTGMAFSRGAESGRWIGLLVVLITAVLLLVVSRAHTRAQVLLLGVVVGGALGNLTDRATRAEDGWLTGPVVDFIDVQWWPIFNIADAAVVCGGILLVWFGTREPPAADHPPDAESVGSGTGSTEDPPGDG